MATLGLSRDPGLRRHSGVPKIVFSFRNSLGGPQRSDKPLHSRVWFIAAKRDGARLAEGGGVWGGVPVVLSQWTALTSPDINDVRPYAQNLAN